MNRKIMNSIEQVVMGVKELEWLITVAQPGLKPYLLERILVESDGLKEAYNKAKVRLAYHSDVLYNHLDPKPMPIQTTESFPEWWPFLEYPLPLETRRIYYSNHVFQLRLGIEGMGNLVVGFDPDECSANVMAYYLRKGIVGFVREAFSEDSPLNDRSKICLAKALLEEGVELGSEYDRWLVEETTDV